MAVSLNPEHVKLLNEPHIAVVATLNRDGSPQLTPVWVDTDGTHVIFNTAEGRVKPRNIRRDNRVAISVFDPANAYARVLNVQGRAVVITQEGAEEHIDKLSKKYTGRSTYPRHDPAHPRLIVKVLPERVTGR
ncbi:MAG: PPOX class F420-dependent oxidoreductase [Chloroflexi bacterium]|nr:PPOX class F420-dependent oxidoreductase [Chloroflexota bacterium]